MQRERLIHIGGGLISMGLEVTAGIMAERSAFAVAGGLMLTGAAVLVLAYSNDIWRRISTGWDFDFQFAQKVVIAIVFVWMAIWFGGFFYRVYLSLIIPEPGLFQPEDWALRSRVFVSDTPAQIMTEYREYTAAQSEKLSSSIRGKWIAITGAVDDVHDSTESLNIVGMPKYAMVSLDSRGNNHIFVSLQFGEKYMDQAILLRKGAIIFAYCKISNQQYGYGVMLDNCEFAHPR